MKNFLVTVVLVIAMGSVQAGFIDSRSSPGSVELDVTYKAVLLEDLALGLIPVSYRVEYERPDLKKSRVTVVGSGTWDKLFDKALKEAGLQSSINEATRVVLVKAIPADPALKPATVAAAAAKPLPTCVLAAGAMIHEELTKCGSLTGWKVIWNLARDWTVPATTAYTGEFPTAAGEVIKTLASNGALIRVKFYSGNKTMVVNGPGVAAQ